MDDMIEPVTCVINEALRKGPDIGASLRGGTVASCAQVYRHIASKYDHDKSETGRRNSGNSGGRSGMAVGIVLNFKSVENAPGTIVTIGTNVQSAGLLHTGVKNVQRPVTKKFTVVPWYQWVSYHRLR